MAVPSPILAPDEQQPCHTATLATDAPGASHSALTFACSSTLERRLDPVPEAALSPVIVSTYSYVETIPHGGTTKIELGSPDAYGLPALKVENTGKLSGAFRRNRLGGRSVALIQIGWSDRAG